MTDKSNISKVRQDEEILKLLDKTNQQYQSYIDICNTASTSFEQSDLKITEYSWDRPLTLSFYKE